VAACMTNIYSTDVVVKSITAVSNRRRLSSSTSSCDVNYQVTYTLAQVVYSNDPSGAYNTLTKQLNTSVVNGNFNIYMQSAATTLHSTTLMGATSTTETPSSYVQVDSTDDDSGSSSSSSTNNVGAIAGSVVGVVLFLAIAVAVYMFYFKGSFSQRDSDTAKNDSTQAPASNTMFTANPMAGTAAVVAEPIPSKHKGEDENAGAVELADRSGAPSGSTEL